MSIREHHHRNDLAGEHRFGDAGQLILACLFFSIWIADTFILQYSTFLNGIVPLGLRVPAGIILIVLAFYLSLTGLSIVFGKERIKPGVIREGVFGRVRHPVYLGEILLYLGLLLFSISLVSTVVWFAAILFLHSISRYEEKLLLNRFGDEYKAYIREVPMWLPRILRMPAGRGGSFK